MTNVMVKPPVVIIPDMSVEERASHITDDMMYDERELAFFKTCREVDERVLKRSRIYIAKTEESIAKRWALIERLEKEQNNK